MNPRQRTLSEGHIHSGLRLYSDRTFQIRRVRGYILQIEEVSS